MPGENNATTNAVPAINEGFTQGGDLTLRSTDSVDFSVDSLFLSVASPVFAELLGTENREETIRFSENAEVLALMLKFIYPKPTPTISSMELLNDALRVANKYQLDSMKVRLREQLVHVDPPVSLYANPLGVLYVASAHGFAAEAELAASNAARRCDFGEGDDLKLLLDAAPNPAITSLVKLTGIPLVKTRVLTEVLFQFERSPMTLHNNSNLIDTLSCGHCRWIYRETTRQSAPEWQVRWARWIFEEVKNRPIVEWQGCFSHSNIRRSFYQPHLQASFCAYRCYDTVPTCDCVDTVTSAAEQFQTWANGVFEHLKSRLVVVAELETQVCGPSLARG
ncbi:hypothetical protein FRC11_004696 [Ceratobasidium sp. 423]|nr:hypothetical protein FRC11_004696 [Ceratobasidium sp. 423]